MQELELDWTCANWDTDLRRSQGGWGYHGFRGSRWVNVNSTDNQSYLLNAYRVLVLTRLSRDRPAPARHDRIHDLTMRAVGMHVAPRR